TSASGSITVLASGVASNPTNITFNVSGNTLSLTWPGSHLGWIAQSNSVNVASGSSWFDIAGSQSGTNLNITINPALANVFYRLRHPRAGVKNAMKQRHMKIKFHKSKGFTLIELLVVIAIIAIL